MNEHTFLLDLPDVLEALNLNVWVADGYEYGQGDYLWTNPHTNVGSYHEKPFGYMVHHSASASANPPPSDTSKASAWIGLLRDGKLYQEGGGVPTIYLASAGPARISSGYGYKPAALDYTFKELRAPVKAGGADGSTALNRYSFNMETVHLGDGSTVDSGVLDHVVGLGIALEQMCNLKEMTLGHRSWTTRKIDPYWDNDASCIIEVQNRVAGDEPTDPPVDPPPSQGDEYMFPTLREGDGYYNGSNPQYRAAVKAEQIMLAYHGFKDAKSVDGTCSADGARGEGTVAASKSFQTAKGLTSDGICGPDTWDELNKEKP